MFRIDVIGQFDAKITEENTTACGIRPVKSGSWIVLGATHVHPQSCAFLCAAMLCAARAASANNSPAEAGHGLVLHTTAGQIAERDAKPLPAAEVKPGDTVTITGECVMPESSADNLLTLADQRPGSRPGFRSVLATDQVVRGDGLQVRVPDMPQTANRVFDVRIFRLGEPMPHVCNAGSIRIGAAAPHKLG
jgi:hypothetical protein